jgi:hypothetical protein
MIFPRPLRFSQGQNFIFKEEPKMRRRSLVLVASPIVSGILWLMLVVAAPLAAGQSTAPQAEAKSDSGKKATPAYKEDWTTPSLKTSQMLPMTVDGPPAVDANHEDYKVELWRVQWRPADPIEVFVIKPTGVSKPPVIVNLWGYPNDVDLYRIEAIQKELVKGGFAVVGFTSALTGQRYHDLPAKMWFVSQLPECLAGTAHDVQLVIDFIEQRHDLDISRIGMFANGSSASIAILASAADPRIKVLDVLDPWGDWPTWLATSTFVPPDERADYVKPEFLKNVAPLETLDWLPKIQAKKFRLQQPAFNSENPASVKEKFRNAAPAGSVVVQYKSMDELKAAFPHSSNLEWLKHELSALPDSSTAEKASAEKH